MFVFSITVTNVIIKMEKSKSNFSIFEKNNQMKLPDLHLLNLQLKACNQKIMIGRINTLDCLIYHP